MSFRYQAPSDISKKKFLDIIAGNEVVSMCQAIVDAVHGIDDYDWLLLEFNGLLKHQNEHVRGVTVTCIGHLARLSPDANREQLLSILQPLLSDSSIVGRVEDAIDDVNFFVSK